MPMRAREKTAGTRVQDPETSKSTSLLGKNTYQCYPNSLNLLPSFKLFIFTAGHHYVSYFEQAAIIGRASDVIEMPTYLPETRCL